MTAASLIAIFLIPVSFSVVEKLAHRKEERKKEEHKPQPGIQRATTEAAD